MKQYKNLIQAAQKAMNNAYAPYSKFQVGAVVVDEKQQVHVGCNVENSAYPLGVCAESSAISAMVLAGGTRIKKILLVATGTQMVTPCGGCRQKIKEFADDETQILIYHAGQIKQFKLEELLPYSFSKKHLI